MRDKRCRHSRRPPERTDLPNLVICHYSTATVNPTWIKVLRHSGLRGKHFAPLAKPLRKLSRVNLLPKGISRWIPVDETFRVTFGSHEGFSYSLSSAWPDGYGRALYWHGIAACEPETITVFLDQVRRARLFLDIGSHTGIYTLLACARNPHLRVFAFEPVPEVQTALIRNLEINGFTVRCSVRPEALSDHCGTAQFHVPVSRDMASLDPRGFLGLPGRLIEVDVCTVDSLIERGTVVDLIKIDVEGFEDAVLRGMNRVLEESRPRIIFECLTQDAANKVNRLLRDGYTFYRLGRHGTEQITHLSPNISAGYRNFLAVPRTRA
jgi:FkbM family methyltransferase